VSLVLVCRILLAVVLAGSAIGKLQDLDDSRQMMVDFGLPYALGRPVGTVLPGIELVVALALLIGRVSWWGAWAALGLMGVFTLAVGLNMAVGRRPDCRCFGSLHVATIGWRVLTRNLLLVALAAVVLLKG
jgi:uncharacterized membrane protein YphA (DoxX/SURF4 family)